VGKPVRRHAGLLRWIYCCVVLAFAAGGIAVLWTVVLSIGWIVRGFMGIPRGKDFRTSE